MRKNPAAVALGKIKTARKAKTSAANGKAGGRPNSWPADNGGKWMRVKIESGPLEGDLAWQLTDSEGNLVGLFDNDGDNLNQGNATWKGAKSAVGPSWV